MPTFTHSEYRSHNHSILLYKSLLIIFSILFISNCYSQTVDSTFIKLKKDTLSEIKAQLKLLQQQETALAAELKKAELNLKRYPIWNKGIFGTIGFNASRFNNWLAKNQSNTSANIISYSLNTFLNMEESKHYWNNRINLAQSWQKFDDKDILDEEDGYQVASDIFNFNSLFAVKFSKTFATSALLEYRTGLLESSLNNPGSLDFGLGLSWKPKEKLVVTVHPINYNTVFSDLNTVSSVGLKTQASYVTKFFNSVDWVSNFSSFISYKEEQLNYWLWSNSLNKNFNHIGIGLEINLKQSRQEAVARNLDENPFQWYYIFGLSYKY